MKFNPIVVDPDLDSLIHIFIKNTMKDFHLIEQASNSLDYLQVRKSCHRILGTALSYGFKDLDLISRRIQSAAEGEKEKEMKDEVNILRAHMDFMKDQFHYEER